ncbi:hypothetical protein P7C70_g6786, partial [Phenoliferia sp. Uapishka_3]
MAPKGPVKPLNQSMLSFGTSTSTKPVHKAVDKGKRNGEDNTDLTTHAAKKALPQLIKTYDLASLIHWDELLRLRRNLARLPPSDAGSTKLDHFKALKNLEFYAKDGTTELPDEMEDDHLHSIFEQQTIHHRIYRSLLSQGEEEKKSS